MVADPKGSFWKGEVLDETTGQKKKTPHRQFLSPEGRYDC